MTIASAAAPPTAITFTKLVVADPELLLPFYRNVFDLEVSARHRAYEGTEEELTEIILRATDSGASVVLLSYVHRPAPPVGEAIVGMKVSDVEAVVRAVPGAGGIIDKPLTSMPEVGVDVAFVRDPEGHLLEVVSLHEGGAVWAAAKNAEGAR